VDDEQDILDLRKQVIEIKAGYKVIVAGNGEHAFELFKTHQPDFILSDIRMPVFDGLGLLKKVRAIDDRVPFVFMTGFTEDYHEDYGQHQVSETLKKPQDIKNIMELITKYLG
jgi:YesN/AraC family two-component response regulator